MNQKKIEIEYLTKINLLQKYNKEYYINNNSLITDNHFDDLKKDIFNLEKKYVFLKNKKSPSQSVGYKPSKNFQKVNHKVPMLSLGNAFNEKDLLNFEKKMINFLSLQNTSTIEYSVEPKIDGISASLIYVKGKFIRGLSRGNGVQG